MLKLSKRQSITLFCGFLLSLPVIVQATAPPLLVCGGIILEEIEEDVTDQGIAP